MQDSVTEQVKELYESGRWREVLQLGAGLAPGAVPLLWAWPSESVINHIAQLSRERRNAGVVSIGCGSGLFEWLLQTATGLPVVGIELDNSWWASRHATNKYIKHKFVSMPVNEQTVPNDHALLFCYFNCIEAFQEYVRKYSGNLVFIVGPGPEQLRYTAPLPLDPNFPNSDEWTLIWHSEIRDSGDFVAAWSR